MWNSKSTHKNQLWFHTIAMNNLIRKLRKIIPFRIALKRIKYLGINPTKKVKDLYTKNCKTLLKEIKTQINGKTFHCLWIRQLSLLRCPHYSKWSTVPAQSLSKSQWHLLQKLKSPKIHMESHRTSNSQKILKENKVGGLTHPGFKTHYTAKVIKTVWY